MTEIDEVLKSSKVKFVILNKIRSGITANTYLAKYKKEVNVAVTGAKSFVYIDKDLSKKLSSSFSLSAINGMKLDSSEMNSDIHASSEFRASLVVTYAKKAVEAC